MNKVTVSLFVAAALVLVAACKTTPEAPPPAPDPKLVDSRMEMGGQTISSFTSTTFATIENPRDEALTIDRVSYTLSARGQPLREGTHTVAVTVQPLGQAEVEVPVVVEYTLTMDEYREIFSGEAVPVVFNGVVHGRVGGDEVSIGLDRAGRLRAPRLPVVSLDIPDGARRRVDEVHATFRLQVDNDNPFDVRLAWVDYVLEVEGNQLRESRVGTGQRLPASGAYVFIIEQDLRPSNVPQLVERMTEDNSISYRIHGELRVGDLVLPFDETDQIRFAGQ